MFFDEGLNFECQRCLFCCAGGPGYVFLSKEDLERASKEVELDEEQFIKAYCREVKLNSGSYMIALKEKQNYDCIFLKSFGCSIYNARPIQCRTYPFWRGVVDSRGAWENEKKSCPGLGKGRKFSKEEILAELEKGDNNPPIIRKK